MTRRLIDQDDASPEVFIAHRNATLPNHVAQALREVLLERGVTCFLDRHDLHAGVAYIRPIQQAIRQARVVVVLFCADASAWVRFEASCAFADEKLMPVSVGGTVPEPFARIQHEQLLHADGTIDHAALGRVADQVRHRVHGHPAETAATLRWRRCNALFFSGLPVVSALLAALLLLRGESLLTEHLRHLHVVLGAAVLGGQFFLALALARMSAAPSFRQRQFGFESIERLFGVWLLLALLQPALGLWFGVRRHGEIAPHVWASLALYLASLALSLCGWIAAGNARRCDEAHEAPRRIEWRSLQANLLFLAGFIVMAAVVNVMLTRALPWQPGAAAAPAQPAQPVRAGAPGVAGPAPASAAAAAQAAQRGQRQRGDGQAAGLGHRRSGGERHVVQEAGVVAGQ